LYFSDIGTFGHSLKLSIHIYIYIYISLVRTELQHTQLRSHSLPHTTVEVLCCGHNAQTLTHVQVILRILQVIFFFEVQGLFARRRMLLLTLGPHLYYVDPVNMIVKGEIPWSPELRVEPKNFKIFFVHTVSFFHVAIFKVWGIGHFWEICYRKRDTLLNFCLIPASLTSLILLQFIFICYSFRREEALQTYSISYIFLEGRCYRCFSIVTAVATVFFVLITIFVFSAIRIAHWDLNM
jgi:hypothetical protein